MRGLHKVAGCTGIAFFRSAGIIEQPMRISIIGPGAVGTLLGALLAAGGHEVAFRGRDVRAAGRRRIRVVLPGGWMNVDAARWQGGEAPAGTPDIVLVTLARHHLHAVRRPDFHRMTGKSECPVVIFNTGGLDLGRLGMPPERQRLALTLLNAVKLQEDDVELSPGKAVVVHERSEQVSECLSVLTRYGIQVSAVDDTGALGHSQLLLQLLALPAAMCSATLDSFLSFPEGRELARNILEEGIAALDKAGMATATLPVLDPRELSARLRKKPASFSGAATLPDRSYGTVLQSYLAGRPTEAAHLNRRIVEIGSSGGLHLTWNWRLLQKSSRAAGLGFYRDPADLLRSLE
jgi:ketopantoate reductase